MHLYFSGGAMEIGGSCIYIKLSGRKLLLDCGIRQSGAKVPLPDSVRPVWQQAFKNLLLSGKTMLFCQPVCRRCSIF